MSDVITADSLDDLQFPTQWTAKANRRVPLQEMVLDWGPLGPEHLEQLRQYGGVLMGVHAPSLKSIRHTHHRLAQYLAMGMDETRAARLCNYNQQAVSRLKSDPAFAELLTYYAKGVQEEFADFVSTAADLSLDLMGRLREILEDEPEKLTPAMTLEAIKVLADRSGNAPVTKSQNVNVNLNLGDRLRAAREREAQAYITAKDIP